MGKNIFVNYILGLTLMFINIQNVTAMDKATIEETPTRILTKKTIFDPITIGEYVLPNRIFMAPMTRGRAMEEAIPGDLMAEYYAQRASAGLIITEATTIIPQGYGWKNTPGIWNEAQQKGWKAVTAAVHEKEGHIFLQLWHTGRVSHPDFLKGELPVGPSEIAARGVSHTPSGKKPYVTPRALTVEEINTIVQDYASAAKRAIGSGFDGVEIHAANGYLIDQFIRDGSNKRTDNYGGTTDNRLRFLMEVTKAVVDTVGAGKVGVRLSPTGGFNDMLDSNPKDTFTRAAQLLNPLKLAYLHTMEALPGNIFAAEGEHVTPHIRKIYEGVLITNGGYDDYLANQALAENAADAIAFGVPFIGNPDLVRRYKEELPITLACSSTYYTQGSYGYTSYGSAK